MLKDVEDTCRELGKQHKATVEAFQSNHEGQLIDRIHEAQNKVDLIVINPAGYTHTSVAIRDALLGVSIPFTEVHISNVHAREQWRNHSYFLDEAVACIVRYEVAIQHAVLNLFPKNTA